MCSSESGVKVACRLRVSLRSDSLRSKEALKIDDCGDSLSAIGAFSVGPEEDKSGTSPRNKSSSSIMLSVVSSKRLSEIV